MADGNVDGPPDHTSNLGLRIGTIFILLTTSAIGSLAPHILSRFAGFTQSQWFKVAKSYAAGVVLATGFIHMMPDAQDSLKAGFGDEVDFPFAALFALSAVLLTLTIEQVAGEYFLSLHKSVSGNANTATAATSADIFHRMHTHHLEPAAAPQAEGQELYSITPKDGFSPTLASTPSYTLAPDGTYVQAQNVYYQPLQQNSPMTPIVPSQIQQQQEPQPAGHGLEASSSSSSHGHSHGHIDLLSKMDLNRNARSFVIAHVLELGIAFHSIIIGITLGVTTNLARLQALLAALVFHQFFEGFALGSSVMEANMKSKIYPIVMSIIFAITTPTGVAIGIGISSTYDENSTTALLTQGTFDSISAGILIYMALVDLVSEEFRDLMTMEHKAKFLRLKMLLALTLGSGCMAMLAIWA